MLFPSLRRYRGDRRITRDIVEAFLRTVSRVSFAVRGAIEVFATFSFSLSLSSFLSRSRSQLLLTLAANDLREG